MTPTSVSPHTRCLQVGLHVVLSTFVLPPSTYISIAAAPASRPPLAGCQQGATSPYSGAEGLQ